MRYIVLNILLYLKMLSDNLVPYQPTRYSLNLYLLLCAVSSFGKRLWQEGRISSLLEENT